MIDRPNLWVDYVDATTLEVLHTEPLYDPELAWGLTKDGEVALARTWGVGRPQDWWLQLNPCPFVRDPRIG